MNESTVYLNVIAGGRLNTKVGTDLPVNGYETGCDDLIAMTAGTDASRSQVTIETHRKIKFVKLLIVKTTPRPAVQARCHDATPAILAGSDCGQPTLLTFNLFGYTSGFVLGRPTTLLPSFHWPRFFSSSTRSKRFKTFRLAAMVLVPFRLRCCDIANNSPSKMNGHVTADADFFNSGTGAL